MSGSVRILGSPIFVVLVGWISNLISLEKNERLAHTLRQASAWPGCLLVSGLKDEVGMTRVKSFL